MVVGLGPVDIAATTTGNMGTPTGISVQTWKCLGSVRSRVVVVPYVTSWNSFDLISSTFFQISGAAS